MLVLMTTTTKGSPDGINVLSYSAGIEYDIPERLAKAFVSMRVAEYVDGIVPIRKAEIVPQNKVEIVPNEKLVLTEDLLKDKSKEDTQEEPEKKKVRRKY